MIKKVRLGLLVTAFILILSGCGAPGGGAGTDGGSDGGSVGSGGGSSGGGSGGGSTGSGSGGGSTGSGSGGGSTGGGSGGSGGGSTATGSVTLSWVAPTTRVDGTSIDMSEIGGYRIYYGSSASNTTNMRDIDDSSITENTLTLQTGIYYFRISCYDSDGIEGPKSAAITRTL